MQRVISIGDLMRKFDFRINEKEVILKLKGILGNVQMTVEEFEVLILMKSRSNSSKASDRPFTDHDRPLPSHESVGFDRTFYTEIPSV
ncbi:9860_t:CDS:2 [Funneliformis mosseae]|uniref:9860_t:CDS:1 n=1 Tax=Funneliformis mosseae TaxID=27381 RepID=A0A9N9GWB2_FUNMO|nr:9860_t:CDS:2 [Funneliformis mosseae]